MAQSHRSDYAAGISWIQCKGSNRIAVRVKRASTNVVGVAAFNLYDAACLDIDLEEPTTPFATIYSKVQFRLGIHSEGGLESGLQTLAAQRSPLHRHSGTKLKQGARGKYKGVSFRRNQPQQRVASQSHSSEIVPAISDATG